MSAGKTTEMPENVLRDGNPSKKGRKHQKTMISRASPPSK